MSRTVLIRTAAALGFLGVALGAFGAHGLKPMLLLHGTLSYWETAVLYQFVHLAAFLFLALTEKASRIAYVCFVAGIAMFSGSLYLLALISPEKLAYPLKALVFVTPAGGMLLLAGWIALFVSAGGSPSRPGSN